MDVMDASFLQPRDTRLEIFGATSHFFPNPMYALVWLRQEGCLPAACGAHGNAEAGTP